jgi:CheY-like chemotaxis protein
MKSEWKPYNPTLRSMPAWNGFGRRGQSEADGTFGFTVNQVRHSELHHSSEVRMSNFVTLLVEDDASQREAFAEILRDEGFEVIECTTAEAAELIIASTGTELQALITDQNLAGAMSGTQLAQYARGRHPHLNIVLMSGKTVTPIPVNTTFLQKPFTAAQLLEAVRD